MKQQKQEKGALLVEVIAVLGLIALMTPILFEQIQKRNEEIIDTQVAAEMRAVKDALSSFIQANEAELAVACGVASKTENVVEYLDEPDDGLCDASDVLNVCNDAADGGGFTGIGDCLYGLGYFAGTLNLDDEDDGYDFLFYGRTVQAGHGAFRPVIHAVAYQATPQAPNLRRASKTAALIGVEGGVVATTGKISGMQEVWNLDVPGIKVNTVAVTTSFDASTNSAILKDATFQNMQASGSVSAPIVAAQNLGATDLFSVGDCVTNVGNDGVTVNAKGSDACAPVFEVNAKTKEITFKGSIKTGVSTGGNCSDGSSGKAACEAIANCVWVATDDSSGECVGEFLLNAAETSMVNDIKLASRGGVKLSDILPKWSLMNVRTVAGNGSDKTISFSEGCPYPSHRYGIVVLPSKFNRNAGEALKIESGMAGPSGSPSVVVKGLKSGEEVIVQEYCVFNEGS